MRPLLSAQASAPALHGFVLEDGATVIFTHSNAQRDHPSAQSRLREGAVDHRLLHGVSMSQLPVTVGPPAPHRAVGTHLY